MGILVLALWASLAAPGAESDPLVKAYPIPQEVAYQTMGKLAAIQGWKLIHTDKDLCLLSFQVPLGFWGQVGTDLNGRPSKHDENVSSITCTPTENGVQVRINYGATGFGSGRPNRKFAEKQFKEFEKLLLPAK